MKKILLFLFVFLLSPVVFADEQSIQAHIDKIGTNILNSNKIEKRIVFVYDSTHKENVLNKNKSITKREVIVYDKAYKHSQNDDELASYLAREIAAASRSYNGVFKGWMSSLQMKAAPKKYELVYDKLAVDYMVKAGYNPLGLIIFINKTCPQTRQDKISNKNLTSKRLAYIYERIYLNYPSFIQNNEYLDNEYYQNFLLTSQNNRRILEQKYKNGKLVQDLKYE